MPELKPQERANRDRLKARKPYVHAKMMKFAGRIERGESIAIIQLQYNYACNFRCQHCSIKKLQHQDRRALTPHNVSMLAKQADEMGLARFVITGGEPLAFRDLDAIVDAIGPDRFYINCDTNGWLLTPAMAHHLKGIGVDRIQLSIDSLAAGEHDSFRNAPGSHARAMLAADAAVDAGLDIFVQTVVAKRRLRSQEFIDFIEHFNAKGIGVFVSYAKPVGAWEGRLDGLIDRDDMKYMEGLEGRHNVFTHLTPAYGLSMGCIAVKGMVSVTQYGDVQPCPYMHVSLGNIFEESLKSIIERGLSIRHFGEHVDTCLIAEDRAFIDKYIAGKVYGRQLPVHYSEVFGEGDWR